MLGKILKHVKQGTLLKVIWNKYHPNKFFIRVLKLPHIYNRLEYKRKFGLFKSINQPETFSQKIYFLRDKYDQNPLATQVSDKLKVRDYIKSLGLEHLLNKLYGVYDSANEINFDILPNQFVIKTNHASGTNIIVQDKSQINENAIKRQLDKWLDFNYAYSSGEMQYLNIQPKIIVEKYLDDGRSEFLIDYKFWCFDGKVEFVHIVERNENGFARYSLDLDFHEIEMFSNTITNKKIFKKPQSLNMMIETAEKIATEFSYARIDLYEINGAPLFGEITLTPTGGNNFYLSKKAQNYLGEMIELERVI